YNKLAGKTLERVESEVYLRREPHMTNNITPEISRRRRAASAASGSIREVTDRVKEPNLRASIFNGSVLPTMCYANETCHENKTIPRPCKQYIVG
ncbi:hypothetical protein TELCIR_23117, partial [Teladorsagia circumcincta]